MIAVFNAVFPLVATLAAAWWCYWTVREVENLRADRRGPRFPEKQD